MLSIFFAFSTSKVVVEVIKRHKMSPILSNTTFCCAENTQSGTREDLLFGGQQTSALWRSYLMAVKQSQGKHKKRKNLNDFYQAKPQQSKKIGERGFNGGAW